MIKRWKRWLQSPGGPAAERPGPGEAEVTRVLMVCMGNICRSPLAEGVLRAKLQRAGLHGRVLVDSAGTHGYHSSEPPDPRAVRLAAQRGYDIAGLRARAVAPTDYQRFHWLLAMDEDNLAWLRKRTPAAATASIALLMDHALQNRTRRTVPDPYYGTDAGFEQVLDLVEDACDGLVKLLLSQPPRSAIARAEP